ncbi:hypothetical protein C1708_29230 [Streptomyces sp. DH-12]|nr:hypothetical protein C1708_29230 [Streptomyces sp. DH-12]
MPLAPERAAVDRVDAAVGGFDDGPAAGAVTPAPTTIRQPGRSCPRSRRSGRRPDTAARSLKFEQMLPFLYGRDDRRGTARGTVA